MKESILVAYIDDILKDQNRCEKIKRTKQQKRIEEHIAMAILNNDPKRAISIAERYNIPPQEFGKMVGKYSNFV